jgi:hypothetical protein
VELVPIGVLSNKDYSALAVHRLDGQALDVALKFKVENWPTRHSCCTLGFIGEFRKHHLEGEIEFVLLETWKLHQYYRFLYS